MQDGRCVLAIDSDCDAVQRLAAELTEVEPFQEISFRRGNPHVLEAASTHCRHAACPVPIGIIKTVEVAAGLALPADVMIRLSKSESDV
jgi:hypothetical protein